MRQESLFPTISVSSKSHELWQPLSPSYLQQKLHFHNIVHGKSIIQQKTITTASSHQQELGFRIAALLFVNYFYKTGKRLVTLF